MKQVLRFTVVVLLLLCEFSLCAQNKKIAVWGPIVPEGSETISVIELRIANSRFRDAISDVPGYELISRSDVENILNELKFQDNGLVGEDGKKLIGQMKGVDVIVSLVLSKGYGLINIESSFIDVESAKVIGSTKSTIAKAGDPEDLAKKCVELAGELTGETSSSNFSYDSRPSFSNTSSNNDLSFKVGGVTFNMIFVQGGTFQMGSYNGRDNEKPVHIVTVSDFYMGELEVTQALWQEVMGTTVYQQRDKFRTDLPMSGVGANNPMYYVNHSEAEEFCGRLNQRLRGHLPDGYSFALPTEAEWEYAARGGSKSNAYTYSGSNNLSDVGWYEDNSNESTHAVGMKRANELGLYDMSGNVWEWCSDWYGSYSGNSLTNPRGPSSGSDRVLRGGCWVSSASYCRVAYRIDFGPSTRLCNFGFRLALVRR